MKMKNMVILCIILTLITTLSGCSMLRQPDPGVQPQPRDQQPPLTPETPPSPPIPNPIDGQGNILSQQLASDISARAKEISGVNNSVAIVIGNMAIIGLEISSETDSAQVEKEVSDDIQKKYSEIDTAYTTSEKNLVDDISTTSEKISRGQPTSELMSDLFQIWQRIQE